VEDLTSSIICGVWAADKQNRARDSMMGVAGKPTTTVATPRFSISRPNALQSNRNNSEKPCFRIRNKENILIYY